MSVSDLLFSFRGRIGVGKFWQGNLIAWVLYLGLIVIIVLINPKLFDNKPGVEPNPGAGLLFLAGILALAVASFAISVKRCHDRGKSGWMSLLSIIPVVGAIWWLVDLGILEGQRFTNEYGPDPKAVDGMSMNNRTSLGSIPSSTADELRKLKSLCDDGIITEQEFQQRKNQLLRGS